MKFNEKDFVFWVYDLNLHMFDMFKALNQKKSILVVAEKELDSSRLKEGWYVPELNGIEVIVSPNLSEIERIVDTNLNAVHIFNGIYSIKTIFLGFKYAIDKKTKIGVFLESGINLGLKGKLRKIKTIFTLMRYGNKIDFLLPMGYLGVKWFKSSFYPPSKIFPFLYVVENEYDKLGEIENNYIGDEIINIIVVAQCIKRKNLNFLLKCIAKYKDMNWNLKIIGEGNKKKSLILLTEKLKLSNKVKFLGTVSNKVVRNYFRESDFSILPSKWDGWGAVINESLIAGVPVLCSNNCGASCLVYGDRGDIFKVNSKKSLSIVLKKWLLKGKTTDKNKENIRDWSNCISSGSVSDYVIEVVDYTYNDQKKQRPIEPWLKAV